MDGSPRLQPTLRRGLPWQARRIEQNASGDDAILQSIDAPFRATAGRLDVFHRHTVVSLSFDHDMAVHGIQMAVAYPMVRARVLVPIGGAGRIDIAKNALQYVRRIHRLF